MFRRKKEKKSNILPKATKTKQRFSKKESEIANESNRFFADTGPALMSKIPVVTKELKEYFRQCKASMEHKKYSFENSKKLL